MDDEREIDLKRFVPRKASRVYFLRILFYIVFLCAILLFIWFKLNKDSSELENLPAEIHGVEVEIK